MKTYPLATFDPVRLGLRKGGLVLFQFGFLFLMRIWQAGVAVGSLRALNFMKALKWTAGVGSEGLWGGALVVEGFVR